MLIAAFAAEVRFQHNLPLTHSAIQENIATGDRPSRMCHTLTSQPWALAAGDASQRGTRQWARGCFHLPLGALSPWDGSKASSASSAALMHSPQLSSLLPGFPQSRRTALKVSICVFEAPSGPPGACCSRTKVSAGDGSQ